MGVPVGILAAMSPGWLGQLVMRTNDVLLAFRTLRGSYECDVAPILAKARAELGGAIVLVWDNLNTHTPAALYEAFPPTEARRILRKLDVHSRTQAAVLVKSLEPEGPPID